MTLATFSGNPNLDVYLPFVRRRVISASAGVGVITITMIGSMPSLIDTATGGNGDWVRVEDVATWANGTWKVAKKSSSTITLTVPNMTPKSLITLPGTSRGRVTRWAFGSVPSGTVKTTSAPNPLFIDHVKLSGRLTYNNSILGDSTMCATQRQVKDILTQFWKLPSVQREYNIKYNMYKNTWDNATLNEYASGGYFSVSKMVNLCMCMIYAASAWNKNGYGGLQRDGFSHDVSTYPGHVFLAHDYDLNVGLWGTTPNWDEFDPAATNSGLRWRNLFNFNSTLTDRFIYLTYPEVSTRISIATMYESLFNDKRHTTPKSLNPFNLFLAGYRNTAGGFKNSRMSSCYGTNCSKCPPYGVYGTKAC